MEGPYGVHEDENSPHTGHSWGPDIKTRVGERPDIPHVTNYIEDEKLDSDFTSPQHRKPYRCKSTECSNVDDFSAIGGLLRHQREAHGMYGQGTKLYLCHFEGCKRAYRKHGFVDRWSLDEHMRRVHGYSASQPSNNSTSPSLSDSSPYNSHKKQTNSQKDRRTSSPTNSITAKRVAETTPRSSEQAFGIHHGTSGLDTMAAHKQPALQQSQQSPSEEVLPAKYFRSRFLDLRDPLALEQYNADNAMFEDHIVSRVSSRDRDSARDSHGQKTEQHLAGRAINLLEEDQTLSALTDYPGPGQMFETSNVGDDDRKKLRFWHEGFDRERDVHIEASGIQPRHRSMASVAAEVTEIKLKDLDAESWIDWHGPSLFDAMSFIRRNVLGGLRKKEFVRGSLTMNWDLLGFIKDQYSDMKNVDLGSVITLSGTVLHAQATTCSEYAGKTWPSQGRMVISAFQSAIDSSRYTTQVLSPNLDIDIDLRQGVCILKAESRNPEIIAQVFQQTVWMGAALRVSRSPQVQYSRFELTKAGAWTLLSNLREYKVRFDTSELPEQERSCWLPIFTNPIIAQGFPIPAREHGEQGLEIPLEMMAALGGARHVTEFDGGLVLKGYSAMFVPVKIYSQSIQWHLIRRGDEQRVLYQEANSECPNRALLEEIDSKSLQNRRAFLGWWKVAETHLGTSDAAYDKIDWSPTSEARRSARISGANIGFQTMITGQLSFIMGPKDGRLHFSQKGPFQKIVQCAEKTPVALYDSADRRAWLVPGLDLMLHIVQTRHHISPYRIGGKPVELASVNPANGRAAATEAIAANRLRRLYECDAATEKDYYFKDAILDIWSQMERLMEKEDSIEARTGLALHGTMRSKIYGWEYMSLVHEKNYQRKEAEVVKSSGGWVDLINDIDALVLFATGLDEIIRPVSDLSNLCQSWRTLPKGKDFLAAGVPILELLYSEAGSRHSRKHLSTSHLQWHRGSTLFEQCSGKSSCRCECDRTQQIYHDSLFKTFGQVKPPGNLAENGCVIFGQTHHSFKPHKKIPIRKNVVHILPNTSIHNEDPTRHDPAKHVRFLQPSLPASDSSDLEGANGYANPGLERPPSSRSSNGDLVQKKVFAPKRRQGLSYDQTIGSDTQEQSQRGKDQIFVSDHQTSNHSTKDQSMLGRKRQPQSQCLQYSQTELASRAGSVPVPYTKIIRHKAKIEDFGHRQGCSCTTCSAPESSPPQSIEIFSNTNGTRSNSMDMAERRERQPV